MPAPLAIVLSGGGARGAFQVGALEELLVHRGVDAGMFCGVSTGAIQALGGAQNDITGLKDVWLSLHHNSDVFTKRPLGRLGGLFGADSIYNANPIRAKIKDFADEAKLRASGKKLLCGVVSLQSGEFRSIHENTPNIGDWVYASCAMPAMFQPLKDAAGSQWVDGGARNITPLDEALQWNPRAVIVIMASPMHKQPDVVKQYEDLISIAMRGAGILTKEVFENDFRHASLINAFLGAREEQARRLMAAGVSAEQYQKVMEPIDMATSRYRFAPIRFIAPQEEVADTLEFDNANIRAGMDKGRAAVDAAWDLIKNLVE